MQERVKDREQGQQSHAESLRRAENRITEQKLQISELELAVHNAERSLRDCTERHNLELEGLQEMNQNLRDIADRHFPTFRAWSPLSWAIADYDRLAPPHWLCPLWCAL